MRSVLHSLMRIASFLPAAMLQTFMNPLHCDNEMMHRCIACFHRLDLPTQLMRTCRGRSSKTQEQWSSDLVSGMHGDLVSGGLDSLAQLRAQTNSLRGS